jgi:hypothetical protein
MTLIQNTAIVMVTGCGDVTLETAEDSSHGHQPPVPYEPASFHGGRLFLWINLHVPG